MIVTSDTLETEVLAVFSQYRVRAGGRLDLADLRAAWPATRLRATDLDAALQSLVFSGALRWVGTDEGDRLELTPSGDWQRQQRPLLSRASVLGWWRQVHKRLKAEPAAVMLRPPMRRHGDQPPNVA